MPTYAKINGFALLIYLLVATRFADAQNFMPNSVKNQSIALQWQIEELSLSEKNSKKTYQLLRFAKATDDVQFPYIPVFTQVIPYSEFNTGSINQRFEVDINVLKATALTGLEETTYGISEIKNAEFKVFTETVQSRGDLFLRIRVIPLRRRDNGQYEKLEQFQININPIKTVQPNINRKNRFSGNSVMQSGNWYKFKIIANGVYRITYEQLGDLGFSNPEAVRVFGFGGGMLSSDNAHFRHADIPEIRLQHTGDAIFFYAQGPVARNYDAAQDFFSQQIHLYGDAAYYFFSDVNTGFDNKIKSAPTIGTNPEIVFSTTRWMDFVEDEIHNLIESGSTWYGDKYDVYTSYDYGFSAPNLITSAQVKFKVKAAARGFAASQMRLNYGGQQGMLEFARIIDDYASAYASESSDYFGFSAGQDLNIQLDYLKNGVESSSAYLDYITVNAKIGLVYEDKQIEIYNPEAIGKIAAYDIKTSNTDLLLWDVSNPLNPQKIQLNFEGNRGRGIHRSDTLANLLVFSPQHALQPHIDGKNTGWVENQNLHAAQNYDMVIVAVPAFVDYAKELADFHQQKSGLSSLIVTPNQVYNEFSSGTPDATAIRHLMKMLYDRNPDKLRYLLLFGDASYDNRMIWQQQSNHVISYQSVNSISPTQSFVTDDFFGLLDDDEYETVGALDIGIGRFPVTQRSQAALMVQKVKLYYSNAALGNWRNDICFIGDDEDNNVHVRDADIMAQYVRANYPHFNIEKIYLDAYRQVVAASGERYPDAESAIRRRMQKSALVLNYTGHGNEYRLAHEKIIDNSDINSWSNAPKFPVFMTATCEFSRFDKHSIVSAGEQILLNPKGGAVALFSTTRLVYSGSNMELNSNFYRYVFENNPQTGRQNRLGDIVRLSKIATGTSHNINKRNFSLLGDPALQLSLPGQHAETKSINRQVLNFDANGQLLSPADTLKALSKATVSGNVLAKNGVHNTAFNGLMYITVYDKEKTISTLANDGGAAFEFDTQNTILFRGKATIRQGKFSFSFIVPKDIGISYGLGKISYYFHQDTAGFNQAEDGHGYFNQVVVGGISSNPISDQQGPEIKLYLNDESFVDGGTSNSSPVLYALLTDSSGINTSDNGIGHDITAILNDNTAQIFVLNDAYETEPDSYQNGKLQYQFSDLPVGEHNLKLKVWDVHNNSATSDIDFVVADSRKLEISRLLNYPNPFTTRTAFMFEHNQAGVPMQVQIQIFSISGKLVKTISGEMLTSGFRSESLFWDGRDDFGAPIGRGVYIYRVIAKTSEGKQAEKYEKLLILN